MESLFELPTLFPGGFTYHPDFITKEEEERLLAEIANIELYTFRFQGYEARRQ